MFYCLVLLSLGALLSPAVGAPQLGGLGDVLGLGDLLFKLLSSLLDKVTTAVNDLLKSQPDPTQALDTFKTAVADLTKAFDDLSKKSSAALSELPTATPEKALETIQGITKSMGEVSKLLVPINDLAGKLKDLPAAQQAEVKPLIEKAYTSLEGLVETISKLIEEAKKVDPSDKMTQATTALKSINAVVIAKVDELKTKLAGLA